MGARLLQGKGQFCVICEVQGMSSILSVLLTLFGKWQEQGSRSLSALQQPVLITHWVNSWSSGFYAVQSSETVVCPPPPPPPPPPPCASIFDNDEKSKVASFIIIFEFAAYIWLLFAFSALTLLVGWQEGHPACKKTEWWGAGVVICLDRGADLHTAQLMPLSLASVKSRLVLPFWYRLTWVVLDKGPLNGCMYVCTGWLKIKYPTGEYAISLKPMVWF